MKQMVNGQLPLERSVQQLTQTVLRLIEDMENNREMDIKQYPRLAQVNTFRDLKMSITNYSLTKIALEWSVLCELAPATLTALGECQCPLLHQFGLPCKHHLFHYYQTGSPVPRSLCHPRWWLNFNGAITITNWAPFTDYTFIERERPKPIFTPVERRILALREELNPENRHRFDRQRERKQDLLDQQMECLGARRLELQQMPIGAPDPVPKRTWTKAKTHGRAYARGITGNEIAERQQERQERQQRQRQQQAQHQREEDWIQQ